MSITYKAIITIGNRENKSGKYGILIRVSMNRRSVYLNRNEKIESRYWSGAENKWVKETEGPGERGQRLKKQLRAKQPATRQLSFG